MHEHKLRSTNLGPRVEVLSDAVTLAEYVAEYTGPADHILINVLNDGTIDIAATTDGIMHCTRFHPNDEKSVWDLMDFLFAYDFDRQYDEHGNCVRTFGNYKITIDANVGRVKVYDKNDDDNVVDLAVVRETHAILAAATAGDFPPNPYTPDVVTTFDNIAEAAEWYFATYCSGTDNLQIIADGTSIWFYGTCVDTLTGQRFEHSAENIQIVLAAAPSNLDKYDRDAVTILENENVYIEMTY